MKKLILSLMVYVGILGLAYCFLGFAYTAHLPSKAEWLGITIPVLTFGEVWRFLIPFALIPELITKVFNIRWASLLISVVTLAATPELYAYFGLTVKYTAWEAIKFVFAYFLANLTAVLMIGAVLLIPGWIIKKLFFSNKK